MNKRRFWKRWLGTGSFALITGALASCGSFQEASSYDPDGIYQDEIVYYREPQSQTQTAPAYNSRQTAQVSTDYEKLFSQKSQLLDSVMDQINQEDIFTDIDDYSSADPADSTAISMQYTSDYQFGNPAWGDNPERYEVYVYNNNWGWGWGWYTPFWGPTWGWGWNAGWGWGWNAGWGWGWNAGWGWGWPYNSWGGWYGAGWAWNPYYPYYPYSNYRHTYTNYRRGYYNNAYTSVNRRDQLANRSSATYNGVRRSTTMNRRNVSSRNGYSNSARVGTDYRNRGYSTSGSTGRQGVYGRTQGSNSASGTIGRPSGNRSNSYSQPSGSTRPSGTMSRSSGSSSRGMSTGGSSRGGGGSSRGGGGGVAAEAVADQNPSEALRSNSNYLTPLFL